MKSWIMPCILDHVGGNWERSETVNLHFAVSKELD